MKPPPTHARSIWKRMGMGAVALCIIYLGSYLMLSATGGYRFQKSGRTFITLPVADTWYWQPRIGYFKSGCIHTVKGDFFGYCYAPLITLDQRFVHPSILCPPIEQSFYIQVPPRNQLHPFERACLDICDRYNPAIKAAGAAHHRNLEMKLTKQMMAEVQNYLEQHLSSAAP